MSTYIGNKIKISIFGQSHSKAIGVNIEGLPSGFPVSVDLITAFLKRRAPKLKTDTARREEDEVEILSGLVDGHTCGTAFCSIIRNKEQIGSDYNHLEFTPRPSHCDYPAFIKYGKFHDFRGGGHFSGRLTAALCLAGSLFIQILRERKIRIAAHISNIGEIEDQAFDPLDPNPQIETLSDAPITLIDHSMIRPMICEIEKYAESGNSIGGSIECAVTGLPAGCGSTMFDSLESRIAQIVFSIPAVKAIEFGKGFSCSKMSGFEYNDFYMIKNGKVVTKTNHSGGIAGGLSTSMPLIFKAALKPTPSIALTQETVNLEQMKNTALSIKGRHDSCIVPRAVPVMEAAAAIACYDLID